MVSALAFVVVGGFVAPWEVRAHDWGLLIFLAVARTALPWMWTLRVLKTLSPYTLAISVAFEPVYSIFFAYLFWPNEERLTWRFYPGTAALFALVVANAALTGRASAGRSPVAGRRSFVKNFGRESAKPDS